MPDIESLVARWREMCEHARLWECQAAYTAAHRIFMEIAAADIETARALSR